MENNFAEDYGVSDLNYSSMNNSLGFKEMSDGENSVINKIFDPEPILKIYEKSMEGGTIINKQWEKTRSALAGNDFIAKSCMGLRAIINPINMLSHKTEEEYYSLLVENVLAFARSCEDEPTIYAKDMPQIFLLYSNSLEMFAGHVIDGHSSEMLRQILTNTYKEVANKVNKEEWNPFKALNKEVR